MQPKHAVIAFLVAFGLIMLIWEPEAIDGIMRAGMRLLGVLMSMVFLYQSYEAFKSFRIEPGGSIAWGFITLAMGSFGLYASIFWL